MWQCFDITSCNTCTGVSSSSGTLKFSPENEAGVLTNRPRHLLGCLYFKCLRVFNCSQYLPCMCGTAPEYRKTLNCVTHEMALKHVCIWWYIINICVRYWRRLSWLVYFSTLSSQVRIQFKTISSWNAKSFPSRLCLYTVTYMCYVLQICTVYSYKTCVLTVERNELILSPLQAKEWI
jgi:hypothetical protein